MSSTTDNGQEDAVQRIVVSHDDLPHFAKNIIASARESGIIVARDGVESPMIIWHGDGSKNNMVLTHCGSEMLAARQLGYKRDIIAVNGLDEMTDLHDVVNKIKKIAPEIVYIPDRGKDPIHFEMVDRMASALKDFGVSVRRMTTNEGGQTSLVGMMRYRASKAQQQNAPEQNVQAQPNNQLYDKQISDTPVEDQKNLIVAVFLTFFLGPIGMFYATASGGFTMIMIYIGALKLGTYYGTPFDDLFIALFLGVPVSIFWTIWAVNDHNRKCRVT